MVNVDSWANPSVGRIPRGWHADNITRRAAFSRRCVAVHRAGTTGGNSGRQRVGILQRRFARVAAGPVAGCHRLRRRGPCTRARTMSPFKRIHSLVIAAATSLAVMGGVTSAQAAIFDFVAAAASNEGVFDNLAAYATVDGITVQAFGLGFANSVAYLDDVAFVSEANPGGRPAGLGVCSAGLGSPSPPGECKDSGDDNVTSGETLRLEFYSDAAANNSMTVTINPIFFRDADHFFNNFDPGNLIDIRINDAIAGFTTFPLISNFTTPLNGTTFDFKFNNEQFYISSLTAVPLPAALPLFLSALAGLALLGRRRRKKAAA